MPVAYRQYLRIMRSAKSPRMFLANAELPLDTLTLYACLDGAVQDARNTQRERKMNDEKIEKQGMIPVSRIPKT